MKYSSKEVKECWNLKISTQDRNRDTDVENGIVDTVGEGESGKNGESGVNIYALSGVR